MSPDGNVLFAAFHAAQKAFPIGAGMHLEFARNAFGRFLPQPRAEARREFALQCSDVAERAIVGAARSFTRNVGGGDNVNLMPQMIERQQSVEEHQFGIGQFQIILRMLANIF